MKKLLTLIICLMVFAGCKKDQDTLVFDKTSEERMDAKLQELSDKLTGAQHGWTAHLTVAKNGGYGFYFQFDKDQKVRMYADLTASTASESKESSYRLKAVMAPSLIFDTYNYITLLQDPDPGSYGGDAGTGHQSDIEFEYVRSTEDSIIMIGKKYRQEFVLVRATAEEEAAYAGGEYATGIADIDQFFITNNNAYLELPIDGGVVQAQLDIDKTNKRLSLTGVLPGGEVQIASQAFYYGLDGVYVTDTLNFEGVNFTKFTWTDTEKLSGIDEGGQTYEIINSLIPVVPLHRLLGVKYSGLFSPFKTIFPGTSKAGEDLLRYFHDNLSNGTTPYSFNYGDIRVAWNLVNQRIELRGFSSQNGGTSGWTTTYVYDYTVDDVGIYTFTHRSGPTGGYVSAVMGQLNEFIKNNRVKFDYYTDSGNLYGAMASVDNPEIVMTFKLYE